MDKRWVHLSRLSVEYQEGARNFVENAHANVINSDFVICPCINCKNLQRHHYDIVYEHLVIRGMNPSYTTWVFHGECVDRQMDQNIDEEELMNVVSDAEISYHEKAYKSKLGAWKKTKMKLKRKENITRVDVWIEGHKRKKNKPLSEAVQTTMDEINQLRESTRPPNDNNINEDSLAKVLGAEKRGRVRGLRFGTTPSRAELEATNNQVASLKEMINMIIKQNELLLNRGGQVEDAVGSHPHVFMPQYSLGPSFKHATCNGFSLVKAQLN
ncbi:hypothetical protein ACOSQ3_003298 [Xanthoceras sorbifolium]